MQKYAESVDTPNKSALFSVPTHLIIRERAAGVAKHRRREQKRPELGLNLFSKNKVRPTFGVRPQLQEILSQKCTGLPLQPPTRTRSARVRCFSIFAFTSSPYDCKKLGNSDLRVKVSPLFPSPVKAKKELFLHSQNALDQRLAGEGEG